jgi:hypothetical protein
MVFNVEALKVFKGCICKKILEPSLRSSKHVVDLFFSS